MISLLRFAGSVAVLLTSFTSFGQLKLATDNPRRLHLDSIVHQCVLRYFNDPKAVGISIGILDRGQTHFYNYGETKAGNYQLPGNGTLYEIGSTTKAFTGIVLAQAVLDHKINLSDDIRKYLNGNYPNLVYQDQPVRIVDLANHTSGITRIFPNVWERPTYDSLNPFAGYSRALLYEGLHRVKLDHRPGKKYSYTNMAVGLLGTILEDTYHENYYGLVTAKILKPLKMESTMIDLSLLPEGRIAWPHDEKRRPVPMWDVSVLPAMGALRSTTADMIKFIEANNKAADPAFRLSHQLTFGTAKEGMALNWFIHSCPEGYQILEHGGGTGGSRSSLDCYPELNSGLIILTNSLADRSQLEKDLLEIIVAVAK